uniref:Refilin-A isoform X2 n=2 Tax=Pogona vitticeps TaxID=103695 RepID=A0ABM5F189_9SAUR
MPLVILVDDVTRQGKKKGIRTSIKERPARCLFKAIIQFTKTSLPDPIDCSLGLEFRETTAFEGELESTRTARGDRTTGGLTGEPSACATSVCLPARGGGFSSARWPSPSPLPSVMVGHLQLQGMEDSLKEKNREGLLDSPDSGLPPSPSPPFYSLASGIVDNRAGGSSSSTEIPGHGRRKDGKEGKLIPYVLLNASPSEIRPRMYPVFFGESIEVNPEPAQEIRCNSEVKYGSERHYRDDIFYCPMPTVTTYRETIIAAPNCTWRNYKSQLIFEPRQKPLRFQSTTIIFPKHTKNIYRTTLNYNLGSAKRWFASSVQLQLCEENSPCIVYTENL